MTTMVRTAPRDAPAVLHDGATGAFKGAVTGGVTLGLGAAAIAAMGHVPMPQFARTVGGAALLGVVGGAAVGAAANAIFPPTQGEGIGARMARSMLVPAVAGATVGLAGSLLTGMVFAGMGGGPLPSSLSLAIIGAGALAGAGAGGLFGALGVVDD